MRLNSSDLYTQIYGKSLSTEQMVSSKHTVQVWRNVITTTSCHVVSCFPISNVISRVGTLQILILIGSSLCGIHLNSVLIVSKDFQFTNPNSQQICNHYSILTKWFVKPKNCSWIQPFLNMEILAKYESSWLGLQIG